MWQWLLPILGPLAYNMLFGGTGDQTVTQETTTETPPTGFKDPGLGLLAPLLLGTLTQNASRFSNFGVPKGGQMTPFLGGQNLQTLLDLLQKEYEGISKDYGKDETPGAGPCIEECKKKFPNYAEGYTDCLSECRSRRREQRQGDRRGGGPRWE